MKLIQELMSLTEAEESYKGKTLQQHINAFNKENHGKKFEWKSSPDFGERKAWKLDNEAIVGTILADCTNFSNMILVYVDKALEQDEPEEDDDYGDEQYHEVPVGKQHYHALDTSQWEEISNEWM